MNWRIYFYIGLLTAFFVAGGLQAQSIEYTYDMAGNRLTRKVITISTPAAAKRNTEKADTVVVSDKLLALSIKIYPNPTTGVLGVEILGASDDEDVRITVFGGQGAQLHSIKAQTGVNPIDISAYPNGWYILRIVSGNENKEFKIIKK